MSEPDTITTHELPAQPPWVVVSRTHEVTAVDERDTRTSRLLTWLGVSALAALVAVAVVGVFAARSLAEREAVNDAATTADLIAEAVIQPALTDDVVDRDPGSRGRPRRGRARLPGEHRHRPRQDLDRRRHHRLLRRGATVGQTFELGADELEVLADPQTRAEVTDLGEPGEPVRARCGPAARGVPPGVDAGRHRPALRDLRAVRRGRRPLRPAVARVRRRHGEQPAVLRRAAASPSDGACWAGTARAAPARGAARARPSTPPLEERRRIAGTLHDGVVQELAATSFAVAGAAARAERGDPELADDLRTSPPARCARASAACGRCWSTSTRPTSTTPASTRRSTDLGGVPAQPRGRR